MSADSAVPIACSLSPAEYAQRLRDFRQLFARSLRDSHREPRRLHLVVDASMARTEDVQDLFEREQECCPFFTFVVEATGGTVRVEAGVPDGAEECLDDLERMALRA